MFSIFSGIEQDMTYSLSDRSLELRGFKWFTHYSAPTVFLVFTAFAGFQIVTRKYQSTGVEILTLALAVIGLLTLWLQKRALKFRVFDTSSGAPDNFERIIAGIEHSDWVITKFKEGAMLELKTRGFPATWRSWGEQVTILFVNNLVYVYSICDPDAHTALTAYGRNRGNIKRIGKMLSGPNTVAPERTQETQSIALARTAKAKYVCDACGSEDNWGDAYCHECGQKLEYEDAK